MIQGWTNGTFQLDSSATNLMFSFYHLDGGLDMTFKKGTLYSPLNEECTIFRIPEVLLYSADCGISTFEVNKLPLPHFRRLSKLNV